jgi:hypothetical protein
MGLADHSDELLWAIESLFEDGEIESGTPAYGVAWKAGHEGYGALNSSERAIFDRIVSPTLRRRMAVDLGRAA